MTLAAIPCFLLLFIGAIAVALFIFAAIIFGFVGCFGESAVPIIMGGVGYELVGNTITSSMDVLNYPLAAALSSIVVILMLILMIGWYLIFDMRTFLGKILEWRGA